MQRLNKLWRLIGTAISFFVFGAGGLCLAISWFPLLRALIWAKRKRHQVAQRSLRVVFRIYLRLLQMLRVLAFRVEGEEILKQEQGCIVVANHPSLLDYVLMASLLPRCQCIVKKPMWKNPFARGAIVSAGYLPNTDTAELLALCQNGLDPEGVLLIFPEGTRSVPGQKIQLHRGAAQIAIRTCRDIRVVHIQCRPTLLAKGEKWYRVPEVKPFFFVRAGEKISMSEFVNTLPSTAVAARGLTDRLTKMLTSFQEEIDHHDESRN